MKATEAIASRKDSEIMGFAAKLPAPPEGIEPRRSIPGASGVYVDFEKLNGTAAQTQRSPASRLRALMVARNRAMLEFKRSQFFLRANR
jgi:hypothetical protein